MTTPRARTFLTVGVFAILVSLCCFCAFWWAVPWRVAYHALTARLAIAASVSRTRTSAPTGARLLNCTGSKTPFCETTVSTYAVNSAIVEQWVAQIGAVKLDPKADAAEIGVIRATITGTVGVSSWEHGDPTYYVDHSGEYVLVVDPGRSHALCLVRR